MKLAMKLGMVLAVVSLFLALVLFSLLTRSAPPPPILDPPPITASPPLITASPAPTFEAQVNAAWQWLADGTIAYAPQEEMRQGVSEIVRARVSPLTSPPPGLTDALPHGAVTEPLKVSGVMAARLVGDPEVFKLEALSDAQQAVVQPYTEWQWRVTPLVPGSHSLDLVLSAQLRLPDKVVASRSFPAKTARIRVKVDPSYVVVRFIGKYWQWLLGSPVVLGAVAVVWRKLQREKKKTPAGF